MDPFIDGRSVFGDEGELDVPEHLFGDEEISAFAKDLLDQFSSHWFAKRR